MTSTGGGDPVSRLPLPRPRKEGGAAAGSKRSPQQHPEKEGAPRGVAES